MIIHLSDVHCKAKSANYSSFASSIAAAAKSHRSSVDNVIVVVTGDIAFSGQEKEYDVAKDFFDEVRRLLNPYKVDFVCCPGNHDNCFDGVGQARKMLIGAVMQENSYDQGVVDVITRPQENYRQFNSKYVSNVVKHENLSTVHEFKFNNTTVMINSLNSVWMAEKKSGSRKCVY